MEKIPCHNTKTRKENLIIFTGKKSNQATYFNSEEKKSFRQTFFFLLYSYTLSFFLPFFLCKLRSETYIIGPRPISRCVSPAWTGRVLMDYSFERQRKSKNPHASSRPWEAVMPDRVCCSSFRQTC